MYKYPFPPFVSKIQRGWGESHIRYLLTLFYYSIIEVQRHPEVHAEFES